MELGLAVGIGSLGIQLLQQVRTLYEFWSNITEAPQSIEHISNYLRVLEDILSKIANDEQRVDHGTDPGSPTVSLPALESCFYDLQTLEHLISSLGSGAKLDTKVKTKWTAIKAVWSVSKIERFQSILDRTLFTLTLEQLRLSRCVPQNTRTRHDEV